MSQTLQTAITSERPIYLTTDIPEIVRPDFDPKASAETADGGSNVILSIPARLKRAGMEMKLLIEGAGGGSRREPDRRMLRLLAQAHHYREMLLTAQRRTMLELAGPTSAGWCGLDSSPRNSPGRSSAAAIRRS